MFCGRNDQRLWLESLEAVTSESCWRKRNLQPNKPATAGRKKNLWNHKRLCRNYIFISKQKEYIQANKKTSNKQTNKANKLTEIIGKMAKEIVARKGCLFSGCRGKERQVVVNVSVHHVSSYRFLLLHKQWTDGVHTFLQRIVIKWGDNTGKAVGTYFTAKKRTVITSLNCIWSSVHVIDKNFFMTTNQQKIGCHPFKNTAQDMQSMFKRNWMYVQILWA